MSRLFCIILALVLALSMAACTTPPAEQAPAESSTAPAPAASESAPASTDAPAEGGEKIVLWDPDSREDWVGALQG